MGAMGASLRGEGKRREQIERRGIVKRIYDVGGGSTAAENGGGKGRHVRVRGNIYGYSVTARWRSTYETLPAGWKRGGLSEEGTYVSGGGGWEV